MNSSNRRWKKRLGESFNLVSKRLEAVQQGLGEMQTLATGVGDLKRVLTNVKARGTWGEVQLGALLEEVLTPDQYDTNVRMIENSQDEVEYAIRLPGRDDEPDSCVWLPIDSKFPLADYEKLVEAADTVLTQLPCRRRPVPSNDLCKLKPRRFTTNTSPRLRPRILPLCLCPPKGFMPRSSVPQVK